MHITFIGSGPAFTAGAGNYQSNMVLQPRRGGPRLLLDCGSDARHGLAELGLGAGDIAAVFVSHLHADHVGGLEWLALTRKYDGRPGKPTLYAPEPLLAPLWQHCLRGGLEATTEGPASLADFFDVVAVPATGRFTWQGHSFELVPVPHVCHGEAVLMWAYGLVVTSAGLTAYITADTIFDRARLQPVYDRCDIVFHDCETGPATGVHARYESLAALPAATRAKMWLYHSDVADQARAAADGFRGFVRPRQSFALEAPASLAGVAPPAATPSAKQGLQG